MTMRQHLKRSRVYVPEPIHGFDVLKWEQETHAKIYPCSFLTFAPLVFRNIRKYNGTRAFK